MTQFLVRQLHLDGPTRVGEFVFPRKTPASLLKIEVLVEFPADSRVLDRRGARIFLVFLSYLL